MAEKNDERETEMQVLVNPDDLGGDDNNDQDDHYVDVQRFNFERNRVWNVICKFVSHLSEDEISEANHNFCSCVDLIIEAYEEKAREVKGLKNIIKVMTQKTKEDKKTIKQLKKNNFKLLKQLASSVCEECGETKITEQLGSLSMQEKLPVGKNEIDGRQAVENMETQTNKLLRKRPYENEESDEDETDSVSEDSHDVKCPHAACGLDALLYMFHKIKIHFCPTRFIQKVGKVTGYKGISCTQILNNLKDKEGHFLTKIYSKDIIKGKQDEVLNEAKGKFKDSGRDVGLLSYSTANYKHCVNVYVSKDGKIKIYDANRGKKYIEDWNQANYVEICILKGEITDGVLITHISKRWYECHVGLCKKELKKLSTPLKQVSENNPGNDLSSASSASDTLDIGHQ